MSTAYLAHYYQSASGGPQMYYRNYPDPTETPRFPNPLNKESVGQSRKSNAIGKISAEERRKKIDKYRLKKQRRIWKKKVSYKCRKLLADKRIRIKGRFITKEESERVKGLLNVPKDQISEDRQNVQQINKNMSQIVAKIKETSSPVQVKQEQKEANTCQVANLTPNVVNKSGAEH